jgi:hypothetical protein
MRRAVLLTIALVLVPAPALACPPPERPGCGNGCGGGDDRCDSVCNNMVTVNVNPPGAQPKSVGCLVPLPWHCDPQPSGHAQL